MMAKYTAMLAYDLSYYRQVEIEAESHDDAVRQAKEMALSPEGNYDAGEFSDFRVVDVTTDGGEVVAEEVSAEE